ncbi:hypothetical protein GQ53DRAFT_745446 [Thozetella sp. PMI_491]|nr:hypothetical protein GQ53DRAFT_745446 [Thozetella sp. PMI_491]
MPSIDAIHESLPYVDPEPTPAERAAAEALIAAERQTVPDDPFHALLPPPHTAKYTPLMEAEMERAAAGTKLAVLDLSRYSSLDPPGADAAKDELELALARAAAAQTYVAGRRAHLALLDSWGKNAWLIGNWQLEGELKSIERELAETKKLIDLVNIQRKNAQEAVGAELQGLEETWKRGVGRVLETEAAVEGLRREVLEARRGAAA